MAAYSVNQTAANIHPRGVQGAFSAAAYQPPPCSLIGREPSSDTAHDAKRKPASAAACRVQPRPRGGGDSGGLSSRLDRTASLWTIGGAAVKRRPCFPPRPASTGPWSAASEP